MRLQREILSWEVLEEAKWKLDMKLELGSPLKPRHHFLELVYKRAVGLLIHKGVQKTGSPGPSPWDRDSFQSRALFFSRRKQPQYEARMLQGWPALGREERDCMWACVECPLGTPGHTQVLIRNPSADIFILSSGGREPCDTSVRTEGMGS